MRRPQWAKMRPFCASQANKYQSKPCQKIPFSLATIQRSFEGSEKDLFWNIFYQWNSYVLLSRMNLFLRALFG